jgi:hypothetical protein
MVARLLRDAHECNEQTLTVDPRLLALDRHQTARP